MFISKLRFPKKVSIVTILAMSIVANILAFKIKIQTIIQFK